MPMIKIPQPAMVLNAENVPGPDYKMWNTRRILQGEDPVWVMRNVAGVAGAAGGKLKALVINCHGYYGVLKDNKWWFDEGGWGFGLDLGTGIKRRNVQKVMAEVKGLIDDIWLVACGVAKITQPGGAGDGNLFCSAMAKTVGCNVYASNAGQNTGLLPYIPYGMIDSFEGKVWRYKSDGSNELTKY